MIDLGSITQLERGTLTIPWAFPDSLTSPASISGGVVTGMIDNMTTGEAYTISGTLTAVSATSATWVLSDTDSGTPGTLELVFKAVVSGVATYTLAARLIVNPHPSASIIPPSPLVGVSVEDAAALAAYQDTLEAATVGEVLTADGAGNATFEPAAGGASDVDDLTTTTGTSTHMVRVAAAGGLEYRTPANVLSDIGAETAGAAAAVLVEAKKEYIILALSDETSDIEVTTPALTFRMPYAMTLTEVRASVTTAATGSAVQVDINKNGTSILSTKLTIDAGEKTSETAVTPPVISDSALADDAEITIDIDAVGSSTAGVGLKVYLIGTR